MLARHFWGGSSLFSRRNSDLLPGANLVDILDVILDPQNLDGSAIALRNLAQGFAFLYLVDLFLLHILDLLLGPIALAGDFVAVARATPIIAGRSLGGRV
jgi:hypothetical protein